MPERSLPAEDVRAARVRNSLYGMAIQKSSPGHGLPLAINVHTVLLHPGRRKKDKKKRCIAQADASTSKRVALKKGGW